jgi:hypothetical protein
MTKNRAKKFKFLATLVATTAVMSGAATLVASADDSVTCREQLARLDGLLQRAKLTPKVGIPVTKARADAAAHRDAGRFKACTESVAEAFKIMRQASP